MTCISSSLRPKSFASSLPGISLFTTNLKKIVAFSAVRGLTSLEDCFAEGKLQTILPSEEKAWNSLRIAQDNLREAEEAVKCGLLRAAINSTYVAIFHAARAILFRDGIREKSHFCIEQYLHTYVTSGALELKWVVFYGNIRSKRDINQYGFEPPATKEEVEAYVHLAAQFLDRMERLLVNR
ncbi:MAG TPA: HEPN domain-containing protein [Methanolinea sp.]|nr:HEPN domain-containing protein [Methanolinea sp.]